MPSKLADILVARKKAELDKEMAKEETDSFAKTIISAISSAVVVPIKDFGNLIKDFGRQMKEAIDGLSQKVEQLVNIPVELPDNSELIAVVQGVKDAVESIPPVVEKTQDKPRVWEFTHERDSRGRLVKTTAKAID